MVRDRLVIVDQEAAIVDLVRRAFPMPFFCVDGFDSAAAAATCLQRNPPSVLLYNLETPQSGNGGLGFLQQVREHYGPRIVIVGIHHTTALADPVLDKCLTKPFDDLEFLQNTVAELLADKRMIWPRTGGAPAVAGTGRSATSAFLREVPEAMLIINPQRQVSLLNPAATRLLGLETHDAVGQWVEALPLDPVLHALLEVNERSKHSICVRLGKSGRVLEVTFAPMTHTTETREGTLFVLRDITAEVRVQELKNHYLSVVSHELRTPLTALNNFVAMLSRDLDGVANPQLLEGVTQQASRLEHQIDRLMLLTTIDRDTSSESPVSFDLVRAVLDAVAPCQVQAKQQGVEFALQLPEQPLVAAGSEEDGRRGVYELVDNAIKFTPPGGTVTVTATRRKDWCLVQVQDDGIGIEAKDHSTIFDEFRQLEHPLTRTHGGAGLGLALVRRIVNRWGGWADVDSEVGSGSVFTLGLKPGRSKDCAATPVVAEPREETCDTQ